METVRRPTTPKFRSSCELLLKLYTLDSARQDGVNGDPVIRVSIITRIPRVQLSRPDSSR